MALWYGLFIPCCLIAAAFMPFPFRRVGSVLAPMLLITTTFGGAGGFGAIGFFDGGGGLLGNGGGCVVGRRPIVPKLFALVGLVLVVTLLRHSA